MFLLGLIYENEHLKGLSYFRKISPYLWWLVCVISSFLVASREKGEKKRRKKTPFKKTRGQNNAIAKGHNLPKTATLKVRHAMVPGSCHFVFSLHDEKKKGGGGGAKRRNNAMHDGFVISHGIVPSFRVAFFFRVSVRLLAWRH